MNRDIEEKGVVALDCLPPETRCLVVPRQRAAPRLAPVGDNHGPQSRATIPFSSMSQFSLFQIELEVEEPDVGEPDVWL